MIQVASLSIIFYFIQLLMLFASSSKFSLHDSWFFQQLSGWKIFQCVNTDYFKPSWLPGGEEDSHIQKHGGALRTF